MRHEVDPKLELETVPGEQGPGSRVLHPGAVDEDVHSALRLQHPRRELPHRAQAGQVAVLDLELALVNKNSNKIRLRGGI